MGIAKIKSQIRKSSPRALVDRLYVWTSVTKRLPSYRVYQEAVKGKVGIEIGGPSVIFKSTLPLYPIVAKLDCANFSDRTIWEGAIQDGKPFHYYLDNPGTQYVAEATNLANLSADRYEFLMSSNCLEHIANPLKAVKEWVRVVAHNGYMLLVLPNKVNNFDHRRPVTSFDHIKQDYEQRVGEDDLTHLHEILELHDLSKDPPAGDLEQFRRRSLANATNRTLHHHVFDPHLIEQVMKFCGVAPIQADSTNTDHIVLGRVKKR